MELAPALGLCLALSLGAGAAGRHLACVLADYQVVYLFQRPESMARALAKAQAEMAPGSWLVSLEFEVAGQPCHSRLQAPDGRPVWVYAL